MPRNDDFFLPNNVDYSEPCADDSNIVDGNIILPFGASLSVLCYLYLMWMYFVQQSPIFRRHPTSKKIAQYFDFQCEFILTSLPFLRSSRRLQVHAGAGVYSDVLVDTVYKDTRVL